MITVDDLIKHWSLDFRKGKTELQIKNYEKEYFENQEITFIAILGEIKVESSKLEIWLSIPCVKEVVGESDYIDGLHYLVTKYEGISVLIDYPLSSDSSKLSSFSKAEKVLVKGLIKSFYHGLIFMTLLSIERTDRIDQRPSFTRKLPAEGDTLYESNENHLKKIEEEKKQKKGQCFIATACYENHDAPEVLILRNFRDKVLLNSKIGRIVVRFYYFTSPPIAKLLDKSERMKTFVRKNIL